MNRLNRGKTEVHQGLTTAVLSIKLAAAGRSFYGITSLQLPSYQYQTIQYSAGPAPQRKLIERPATRQNNGGSSLNCALFLAYQD